MYVCMYVCMCVYVCVYMCVCPQSLALKRGSRPPAARTAAAIKGIANITNQTYVNSHYCNLVKHNIT